MGGVNGLHICKPICTYSLLITCDILSNLLVSACNLFLFSWHWLQEDSPVCMRPVAVNYAFRIAPLKLNCYWRVRLELIEAQLWHEQQPASGHSCLWRVTGQSLEIHYRVLQNIIASRFYSSENPCMLWLFCTSSLSSHKITSLSSFIFHRFMLMAQQ